jgi:hypothetical protein
MFVSANIAYIWFVKDPQFEQRAAPTTKLIEELKNEQAKQILIADFPYNPWVAKLTTRLVPGWQPEVITVNQPATSCTACRKLRWNSKTESYSSF